MIIKQRLFEPTGVEFTQKRIRNFLSIIATIYTKEEPIDHEQYITIGNLIIKMHGGTTLLKKVRIHADYHRTYDPLSKPAMDYVKEVLSK
jgi:hypothetical protein